jgi:putative ATP-dependent endonuclease of OLD family
MSHIRIEELIIKNYRSFGNEAQTFKFPNIEHKKPVAIVGYNNCGKSNLINCILYSLQLKFVSVDTFTINDFHFKDYKNQPDFRLKVKSSTETKFDGISLANLEGYHRLHIYMDETEIIGAKIKSSDLGGNDNFKAFGASRYYNIFFINFHNIKEEILTKRTSWGNLKSFLSKHIYKIIQNDTVIIEGQKQFELETKQATNKILADSNLYNFISDIKNNFINNLRENKFEVDFSLPSFDDIFHQMTFKVGLHELENSFVPIEHFGDGYISMFVMAVIKSIAESSLNDKCLFIFEEPESFLHENHQEYFYKNVLCGLSEGGHQVIYTTHSARMVDPFDTKSLIRLEFDDIKKQTINKYNPSESFDPIIESEEDEVINLKIYNEYIKSIEPNLNRILFSNKVLLVEGPNDVMVYKRAIEQKVLNLINGNDSIEYKERFSETYLNFHNIAIIPHHGKSTAILLAKLCNHIQLNYYIINDWDIDVDIPDSVLEIKTMEEYKRNSIYLSLSTSQKKQLTNNWNLFNSSMKKQIHFNKPKLEKVIGYESDNKSSWGIWQLLISMKAHDFKENLFPRSLELFLGFDTLEPIQLSTSCSE